MSSPKLCPGCGFAFRTAGSWMNHAQYGHNGCTEEKRFWGRVNKDDPTGCWLWLAAKNEHGYGLVGLTRDSRHLTYRAHRYSWELVNGKAPAGGQILHRCDVRLCVNPDHLFLGNNAVNMRDKALKGRAGTVLTLDQVREIKVALETWEPGTTIALARKYGVSSALINGIKSGRHYAYIT